MEQPLAWPGGFPVGALVEINGLEEKATQLEEDEGDRLEPIDLNGAKAHLILWLEESQKWHAVTFGGVFCFVHFSFLRSLEPHEVGCYDVVMGPAPDYTVIAAMMCDALVEKGFVTMRAFLTNDETHKIIEIIKELDHVGGLTRFSRGFEPGYLGRGDRVKVAHHDSDSQRNVSGHPLKVVDDQLSMLHQELQPYMRTYFGFELTNRSRTLLRMSIFDDGDSEKDRPFLDDGDNVEGFLSFMGRKRLVGLLFLGPALGQLRLLPKEGSGFRDEISVAVEHMTMVWFLTEHFDFSCESEGESCTLQSFLLEPALNFHLSNFSGEPESDPMPGHPKPPGPEVLVKGIASRDPCGSDTEDTLWMALRHAGCDGFLEIPSERFDVNTYIDYTDPNAAQRGKSYCRHQGQIEGIDYFDFKFFSITENEATTMDPEQRIILETGWDALAYGGYDPVKLNRGQHQAHVGIFVGISSSDHRSVISDLTAQNVAIDTQNGIPEVFIANRVSYCLNLKGPSSIMNTACSASLVATHTAKLHLLYPFDPLDGCVSAGVSLNMSPHTWIGNCAAGMLSFRGRCFTFNDSADGYGRGEGCAALFLKRESYTKKTEAFGLLAGSNTNSDGRSATLTAPNGPAQQRLLRAVLEETKLLPGQLEVYEAHGTGTLLGDPIEMNGVRKVLKERDFPLMVSCSKTNFGHLEGGAGASALCKCFLSVMHNEIIANQHLHLLNPHFDMGGFDSQMPTEAIPCLATSVYMGVSGFGYGGTNSHCLTYGWNVCTSRGHHHPKKLENALLRQVNNPAPPEVLIEGDDYEKWLTDGIPHLDKRVRKGATYVTELAKDGRAIWRIEEEPEIFQPEDVTFMIQGSFNSWTMEELKRSSDVDCLHTFELEIGEHGRESFQIIVDGDPDSILYPSVPNCTKKSTPICGPETQPSHEFAWVIEAPVKKRFQIEVFARGKSKSVIWLPCRPSDLSDVPHREDLE